MLFAVMSGFHLRVVLLLLLVYLSVCLALYLSDLRETAAVYKLDVDLDAIKQM